MGECAALGVCGERRELCWCSAWAVGVDSGAEQSNLGDLALGHGGGEGRHEDLVHLHVARRLRRRTTRGAHQFSSRRIGLGATRAGDTRAGAHAGRGETGSYRGGSGGSRGGGGRLSLRSRSTAGTLCRSRLDVIRALAQDRHRGADGCDLALADEDLGDEALLVGLDVHVRLVALNDKHHVARAHLVADRDQPL